MRLQSVISLLAVTLMAALTMLGCSDNGSNPGNDSPTISSLVASAATVDPTERVTITCTAADSDGDSLCFAWGADAGEVAGSGSSVYWTAPAGGGSYSIWVEVSDGKGGEAADSVGVSVTDGFFLVRTQSGLMAVALDGSKSLFYSSGGEVEVLGERIFIGPSGNIAEIDLDGNVVGSITRPPQIPGASTFVVLPDGGFAFVSNSTDSIYFMAPDGSFITAGPIAAPSPDLQSTSGVVVRDRLTMVDSGPELVLAYDLATHEGSVLMNLSDQFLPTYGIDYSNGYFYVSGSYKVCRFPEGGNVETVGTLPAGNVVGIVVVGSYVYGVANFGNAMYKMNIYTGEYETVADGLTSPKDVEFVRLGP